MPIGKYKNKRKAPKKAKKGAKKAGSKKNVKISGSRILYGAKK